MNTALTTKSCGPCRRSDHDRCVVAGCDCPICNPPEDDELDADADPAVLDDAGEDELEILWEEPAGRGRRLEEVVGDAVRRQLQAHPKRWARVREYPGKTTAGSIAAAIAKGKRPELPAELWGAAGRRVDGGGSALYLQYLGGTDE